MSDINKLVRDSEPSKKTTSLSSDINFESLTIKMRDALIATHEGVIEDNLRAQGKDPTPAGAKTPFMKQKLLGGKVSAPLAAAGVGAVGLTTAGTYGLKALAARTKRIEDAKNKEIAKAVLAAKKQQLNQLAQKSQFGLPGQQVADVSKNTLAGKSGDMTQSMGQAAGQWGQTLKAGLGGVADFATRNPHLALAATALGGVAALKRLRRK